MDTGYYDHDVFKVTEDITHLHESEVKWHLDKLKSAKDRRVILFSHHQLFSSFVPIGGHSANPYLLKDFKEPLKQGQISAWFWGHEHLLEIYAPYLNLPKGRCIGYSAFPMLTVSDPYKVVNKEVPLLPDPKHPDTFIQLGTSDEVYNHGYTILKLGKKDAHVSYYEMPGDGSSSKSTLMYEERI